MEQLDLLNSELLENQFHYLENINRDDSRKNNVVISGYSYSTGVVQPFLKIENKK
jgi:hypothetical protein